VADEFFVDRYPELAGELDMEPPTELVDVALDLLMRIEPDEYEPTTPPSELLERAQGQRPTGRVPRWEDRRQAFLNDLTRMSLAQVLDLFERLEAEYGSNMFWHQDIQSILDQHEVPVACDLGVMYPSEEPLEAELDVADPVVEAGSVLAQHPSVQHHWELADESFRHGRYATAIAHAVNALEAAAHVAAGVTKGQPALVDSLHSVIGAGNRSALSKAALNLHAFGSALPSGRHGSHQGPDASRGEAKLTIRLVAAWLVHLLGERP
jgi:hypothetical protein